RVLRTVTSTVGQRRTASDRTDECAGQRGVAQSGAVQRRGRAFYSSPPTSAAQRDAGPHTSTVDEPDSVHPNRVTAPARGGGSCQARCAGSPPRPATRAAVCTRRAALHTRT